jgi:CRP-like cAMP-binding protein
MLMTYFSSLKPRYNYINKLLRYCRLREFSAGSSIYFENDTATSCFFIKSGTCELLSHKVPLRHGENRPGAKSYVKFRHEDKSITLGTHEGSFSEAFRQFRFADVSEGQWLAEESIFHEQGKISYTMRAKTKLTVLEIASSDLK